LTRRRLLLIYDAFIPLHEALVEDRGLFPPSSLFSRLLHAFEASCLRNADICFVDTEAHRRYLFQEFKIKPGKIKVVRVGATIPSLYSEPVPTRMDRDFRIVFAGTLIPLQGVDVILEAACLLREHAGISFCVVGSGQLEKTMHELAARGNLSRVTFTGWLPTDQLGEILRTHHLSLGIFGTTPKAGRVIPSKVYDICAAGVAFVSADTPAIREEFTHLENAFLVPAGSPRELANAILRLKSDPGLRSRLASAAFQTGRVSFSQARIGLQVLAAVTQKSGDRPPARV
jgi:glycosyltransferase involved in cell wall biosynthesis